MTKEQFWIWFDNNKEKLERLFDMQNIDYEDIFSTLLSNLKLYSDLLIPGLKKTADGRYVLVIGCDGVRRGVQYVEALVDEKMTFGNWLIQKYADPDPEESISINGLKIKRDDVFLNWERLSSGKYHITLFQRSLSVDLRFKAAAIMHLQLTIGELNALTRVESIKFKTKLLFLPRNMYKSLDNFKMELDNNFA